MAIGSWLAIAYLHNVYEFNLYGENDSIFELASQLLEALLPKVSGIPYIHP